MPDRAEIVAGAEFGFGNAEDFAIRFFAEDRNAGLGAPFFVFKTHILVESGSLGRVHFEFPTAGEGEFLLGFAVVGGDDHKAGPVFEMVKNAVEAVRLHRAIGTAGPHIVD